MTKATKFLGTSLGTIIACIFFEITPVSADECQLDSQQKTKCVECTFEKERGTAYATGECRDLCKQWGQSNSTIDGEPYQSYNYIAWDSGLRICNISTAPIYVADCPRVAAGTSECNY